MKTVLSKIFQFYGLSQDWKELEGEINFFFNQVSLRCLYKTSTGLGCPYDSENTTRLQVKLCANIDVNATGLKHTDIKANFLCIHVCMLMNNNHK